MHLCTWQQCIHLNFSFKKLHFYFLLLHNSCKIWHFFHWWNTSEFNSMIVCFEQCSKQFFRLYAKNWTARKKTRVWMKRKLFKFIFINMLESFRREEKIFRESWKSSEREKNIERVSVHSTAEIEDWIKTVFNWIDRDDYKILINYNLKKNPGKNPGILIATKY